MGFTMPQVCPVGLLRISNPDLVQQNAKILIAAMGLLPQAEDRIRKPSRSHQGPFQPYSMFNIITFSIHWNLNKTLLVILILLSHEEKLQSLTA